jgi:hypothetical protein
MGVGVGALAVVGATLFCGCGGSVFTVVPAAGDDGGGSQLDAGGDDAGGDGGPTGFCASKAGQVDFCSDFDQAALPENWDAITKTSPATLVSDTSDSVSSPSSAIATTPALTGGSSTSAPPTSTAALVKKNLPKGAAHIQFDLQVSEVSFPDTTTNSTGAVMFILVTVGKDYGLALALRGTPTGPFALWFIEFPSIANASTVKPNFSQLKTPPRVSAWSHITVDVPAAGSGGSVTIHVDQGEAQTFSINPGTALLSTERALTMGSLAQGPVGEAKIRLDNVTWSH